MSCCSGCAKFWLIIVNLLVFLVGVLFLAGGIIIYVGLETVEKAYESVLSNAPEIVRESGFVGYGSESFATARDLNLQMVLGPAGIAFIVVGIVLMIICTFGCFGACCHNVCMLSTYSAIVIFIMLLEVVLVVLLFAAGTKFQTEAKGVMKKSIETQYEGIQGSNPITLLWNFGQLNFKCCGTDNYEDFYKAQKWNRTVLLNSTNVVSSVRLEIPMSCCKMNGTFPSAVPLDRQCAYRSTDTNSYKNKGCYDRIVEWVKMYQTYIIIAGVVLFVFELLIVILSVTLLCIKRDDEDDDDQDYYKTGVI